MTAGTPPPYEGFDRRELRLFLIVAVVLVVSRAIASRMLLVYDDAFITFTYARNLAAGHGFVYYPGDMVMGTTAPLYGLVCSLFYLMHIPMPTGALVFNVMLEVGVLALTALSVPRPRRYLVLAVFGVIYAASPIISRVGVGGMETSLYLAAALGAVALFVRRRRGPAFAIAALCCFLRPEAILLLAVLGAIQMWETRGSETWRLALIALVCIAVPVAVMYAVYGQVLPQSMVAKSGHGTTLAHVLERFLAPDPMMAALLVLALWGSVVVARARVQTALVVLAWSALYVIAYALARPKVWSWYPAPVYYAVALLGAYGFVDLAPYLRLRTIAKSLAPVLVLAPVGVWVAAAVVVGVDPPERNVRAQIRDWCERTIHDPSRTIGADDIGVIGYYSRAHIDDLAGLVWPEAVRYESWTAMLRAADPDYIFLNASPTAATTMQDPVLSVRYRAIARFSRNPDAPLSLDPAGLPRRWTADYIVYRRLRETGEAP